MRKSGTRAVRGMTLIEVAAAMAITMVMLLGVVTTIIGSKRMVARGNLQTIATQLARARLDRVLLAPRSSQGLASLALKTATVDTSFISGVKTNVTTSNTAPAGYPWALDPEPLDGGGVDLTRGTFFNSAGAPIDTSSMSPAPATCAGGPGGSLCREVAIFSGISGVNPTASGFSGTAIPNDQLFTVLVRVTRVGDPSFNVVVSQVVSR